ncbi:XRE family transcriptional regulator [uncultured Microbacterium sp.]|uniref:XRE family transcriptional regulator n=1 Tax=uncultured Microbacterium sp. TaxID=191216 RepID=UPI0026067E11|nr:XRE family transcriptional regulator [uncultured Microbacterium sp.]
MIDPQARSEDHRDLQAIEHARRALAEGASQQVFNGDLARAARILVQVSAQYVAQEAEVTRDELRDFEKGGDRMSSEQQSRLRAALESLGAEFLPDDGPDGGYGVRLKFGRSKIYSLDRWEGEGGTTAQNRV